MSNIRSASPSVTARGGPAVQPPGRAPAAARVRPVHGRVLDELRSALLAGGFPPGTRLPEAELAKRLGVSRAPVRGALVQLAEEGLISWDSGGGAVVVERDDELDGIYRVAAVIEEEIFARAALRRTEADLKRLQRIVDDMDHLVRIGDVIETAEADVRFHALVAEISGLGLLRHLLAYMHGLSRTRTRQKLQQPGMRWDHWFGIMVASHQALVDELRSSDPDGVARAVRQHLYELKDASALDREGLQHPARGETPTV